MLNADKYIDRLRVIVKSADELEKHLNKTNFILYRVKDVIKDYDEDFDKALEHYGSGLSSTMRRNDIKTSS